GDIVARMGDEAVQDELLSHRVPEPRSHGLEHALGGLGVPADRTNISLDDREGDLHGGPPFWLSASVVGGSKHTPADNLAHPAGASVPRPASRSPPGRPRAAARASC